MKYISVLFLIVVSACSFAQPSVSINNNQYWTEVVNGSTVDFVVRNNNGPTILYIPGCNGLDTFGQQYQKYHVEKFKEYWPDANIVISQYVNDYTNNAKDGRCDWSGSDSRLQGKQSFDQAEQTIKIANWIKHQSWSNGVVHLFGFSWGGRVGLWLSADIRGKAEVFKSVALIWPNCRSDEKFVAGTLHTPTRIWATEFDPLSDPKNCPTFYSGHQEMISISVFPGSNHSWFTGSFFQSFNKYWPVQKVWVHHEFNQGWTNQTLREWKDWAVSL